MAGHSVESAARAGAAAVSAAMHADLFDPAANVSGFLPSNALAAGTTSDRSLAAGVAIPDLLESEWEGQMFELVIQSG